ncbi:MAG: aldo/keto reductase [Candidatus Thermoplasmatota archaeon]|nr:aldo/keto reductase [Candidatus Thermoplasmatota archaeon]
MQYRNFGRTGWKVSALGFGCMRLPTTDGKPMSEKIDRKKATHMIRYAIDHGVNYVDTAYPYHGGKSETLLTSALKDGYRDKVKIATKSPVWLIKKQRDFDRYLDEQLKKLKTDQIDFYLFHALNGKSWKDKVLKFGLLDRAEAALEDGRIGRLGFSFHDSYKAFKEIIDGYDGWSFCQIQYNYLDTNYQAGTRGLRYAASKGLPVVIMEPLLGGRLATPPTPVRKLLAGRKADRTPADLALQWIWNQPEVSVVLSGMSTFGQVRGNIRSAESSGIDSLKKNDLRLIGRLQRKYRDMSPVPCTRCGYCMPCPNGVNIPSNFEIFIDGIVNDDLKGARRAYGRFLGEKARASACIGCRKCEKRCPQGIHISEWMPKIHAALKERTPA